MDIPNEIPIAVWEEICKTNVSISVGLLDKIRLLIEDCSSRGMFKASDMSTIGQIYDPIKKGISRKVEDYYKNYQHKQPLYQPIQSVQQPVQQPIQVSAKDDFNFITNTREMSNIDKQKLEQQQQQNQKMQNMQFNQDTRAQPLRQLPPPIETRLTSEKMIEPLKYNDIATMMRQQ